MKPTKKQLQEMYKYAKELYDGCTYADIYDLKRIYNDIVDEFGLDIAFGIDGNEDGGDDEIYCYVHINCVGSLVFNWGCDRFTDEGDYKEAVDYILELEEEGAKILEQQEESKKLQKENESLKAQLKEAKEYLHSNFSF